MAEWNFDLVIEGVDVGPFTLRDASVKAGRNDPSQQPDATTATFVLAVAANEIAWTRKVQVGQKVILRSQEVPGYILFNGTVTDLELDHQGDNTWLLSLVAVGPLAAFQRHLADVIPNTQLAVEYDTQRIKRALQWGGMSGSGVADEPLISVTAKEVNPTDSAYEVAAGAAIAADGILYEDVVGGRIAYQSPNVRKDVALIPPDYLRNAISNPKPMSTQFFYLGDLLVADPATFTPGLADPSVPGGYYAAARLGFLDELSFLPPGVPVGGPGDMTSPAIPGQQWNLSAYARLKIPAGQTSPSPMSLGISAFTSDRVTILDSAYLTWWYNTTWQRKQISFRVPSGAAYIHVHFMTILPLYGDNTDFDFGAVLLEPYGYAYDPGYFDGDTPGYRWVGTPNLSESEKISTTKDEAGTQAYEIVRSPELLRSWVRADAHSWSQIVGALRNSVNVAYGSSDPRGNSKIEDPTSIAQFGKFEYGFDSEIETGAVAAERAQTILEAYAFPRWALTTLTVIVNEMKGARNQITTTLDNLTTFATLINAPTPASAPIPQVISWVEGWEHVITDNLWELVLTLSSAEVEITLTIANPAAGLITCVASYKGQPVAFGVMTLEWSSPGGWVESPHGISYIHQPAPSGQWEGLVAGTYRVRWNGAAVSGNQLAETISAPITIAGASPIPVIAFTVLPKKGPIPLEVTWDASGSYDPQGLPLTFEITLPDLTVSPLATGTYTITTEGDHTFTALIRDPDGYTATKSVVVEGYVPGVGLGLRRNLHPDGTCQGGGGRISILMTSVYTPYHAYHSVIPTTTDWGLIGTDDGNRGFFSDHETPYVPFMIQVQPDDRCSVSYEIRHDNIPTPVVAFRWVGVRGFVDEQMMDVELIEPSGYTGAPEPIEGQGSLALLDHTGNPMSMSFGVWTRVHRSFVVGTRWRIYPYVEGAQWSDIPEGEVLRVWYYDYFMGSGGGDFTVDAYQRNHIFEILDPVAYHEPEEYDDFRGCIDGSMEGYEWEGVPWQSPSRSIPPVE